MINRLDAVMVREKDDKSYFTKVGVAFPSKKGSGYTLILDAIPAPEDGQYKILLMEPRQNDNGRQQRSQANYRDHLPDDDSSIPF